MKSRGRLLFIIILPFMRLWLRRTSRAYCLISCEEEVLMVKAWLGRQQWQLPGGGIRQGEDPLQAVARELDEELSITIDSKNLRFLTNGVWRTDKLGHKYQVYVLDLKQKPAHTIHRHEIIEATWLKTQQLNDSNTASEVLTVIRLANLL